MPELRRRTKMDRIFLRKVQAPVRRRGSGTDSLAKATARQPPRPTAPDQNRPPAATRLDAGQQVGIDRGILGPTQYVPVPLPAASGKYGCRHIKASSRSSRRRMIAPSFPMSRNTDSVNSVNGKIRHRL